MSIIVVGAGIIGALTAFRLAEAGAQVTVIDAAAPAAAASGASFGWINASFYADTDHFNLRAASMAAHRRLSESLSSRAYQWAGCLCWEEEGDAFDRQHADLKALGYAVEEVDRATFANLEPAVVAPERALRFADEGAVDLTVLAREALAAACSLGAKIVTGLPVEALVTHGNRVRGLRWSGGEIAADRVVLATGTATEGLLAGVGVRLPMLTRPGVILRSACQPPLVSHVLVAPGQELRQLADGRFLAPTSAAHQSDITERVETNPALLAETAAARVGRLLERDIGWEEVRLAHRPVPEDGLPVIGPGGPEGLYVSTMHSGATLAPLAAELAAAEVMELELSNAQAALIAPYRPQRFKA